MTKPIMSEFAEILELTKKLEDELNIKKSFEDMLAEKDWNGINELRLDLSERGYGEFEIELMDSLTADEIQEYKKWDRKVNGDIETQMDDNS